ncbi:MAG: hypothetical protein ABSE82_16795 [Nitrososphaerales archaeon]|jgi:hypothetical protein
MNPKKILLGLLHSKFGKLLPVLIVAGLTASASATVFVMYYGSATATVQTADVQLVNLADAHASCTTYPCANSSLATGTHNDSATIGVSMYASTAVTPHPSTYYTNFIGVKNSGSASHTINSISISNIVDASSSLGNITIFLCASSVDISVQANAATCAHYSITSTTGGSLASGSTVTMPYTLAASSTAVIEVQAYASATATSSHTVTFQVAMSWV